MRRGQAVGFEEFAAGRWSALLHFARLLTGGNRHQAEDLVQESLVKLWSVWHKVGDEAQAALGGGGKVLSCSQLTVKNGTGFELAMRVPPGLLGNYVQYDAPYKDERLFVGVQSCNATGSCDTGWGPGVPPLRPTAAKPPLTIDLLHRISVDPTWSGSPRRP